MAAGDQPDPRQLDEALDYWRHLFDEHSRNLNAYSDALREADRNLKSPAVLEVARRLRSTIASLAHSQPRDPATGFIGWREEAYPDYSLGSSPIWNEPDPPPPASIFELPGVVVLDQLVSEGEWGSLRVAEALVSSDSVEVVIERIQLRGSQDLETWRARDRQLDGWIPGGGDPAPMTVTGPAHPAAEMCGGSGADAYRGVRKTEVHYCLVGPFAPGNLHCVLPTPDPDIGVIEFDLDAAQLIDARKLGWSRP
jgi:hypothetical protein